MAESTMTDDVQIIIVQKLWTEMKLNCSADCKVKNLKWKIYDILKSCPAYQRISPEDQRLFFEGIELDDPDSRLEDYGVDSQLSPSSSALPYFRIWLLERYNGIPQTYFLDQAIFDHKWDRSFENIARPVNARLPLRGGRPYTPPLGCVRYGVKVLGKYQNDSWLGGKGLRPDEEWPVAYHGTKEVNVMDILRNGFDLEKGHRFAFGRGIYCTPDPKVALGYAYEYDFIDNQFQDMPFKLIIQCRVDPKKLNSGVGDDGVWLVSDGSAIRPYGICVYPAELANKMMTMPD